MSDSDQRDEQDEAEAVDAETTDSLDDDYPENFPPDEPLGVEEYGLTEAEEEAGESERLRSAREVPEDDELEPVDLFDEFEGEPDVREQVNGLAAADDDADGELLGELFDDDVDASGEESAMHIVDEP